MTNCKHHITYLGSIYHDKTGERLGCGVIDIVCEKGHDWHMLLCAVGLGRLCRSFELGERQCEFTSHDPIQRELQDERIENAVKKQKEHGIYDYKREAMWNDTFDCINEMFDRCSF